MSSVKSLEWEKNARNEGAEAFVSKIDHLLLQFEDGHVARQLNSNEVAKRWEALVWDSSQNHGGPVAVYMRKLEEQLKDFDRWNECLLYGSGKHQFTEGLRKLFPTHFMSIPVTRPPIKVPKSRMGLNKANANTNTNATADTATGTQADTDVQKSIATDNGIGTQIDVDTHSNTDTRIDITGYASLAAKEEAMMNADDPPGQNASLDQHVRWKNRKDFREKLSALVDKYGIQDETLSNLNILQCAECLECIAKWKGLENPDNPYKYGNEIEDCHFDFDDWLENDLSHEFRKFVQKQPNRSMEMTGLAEVISQLLNLYSSDDEMSIINAKQLAVAWELQIWHNTYVKNQIPGEYLGDLMNESFHLESFKVGFFDEDAGLNGKEQFRQEVKEFFPDLFASASGPATQPTTQPTAQQQLDDELYDLAGGNDPDDEEKWENALYTDNTKTNGNKQYWDSGSDSELSECPSDLESIPLGDFNLVYGKLAPKANARTANGLSAGFLEDNTNDIETPVSPSPSQQGCSDESLKQQGAFSNPGPQTDITGTSNGWPIPGLPTWNKQQGFNTSSEWVNNTIGQLPQSQPAASAFQPSAFQQNLNAPIGGFQFTAPQNEQSYPTPQSFLPQLTTQNVFEYSNAMDGTLTNTGDFLNQLPSPQESTNGLFEECDAMDYSSGDDCMQDLDSNEHPFFSDETIKNAFNLDDGANGLGYTPAMDAPRLGEQIPAPASTYYDEMMTPAPESQDCEPVEYSKDMDYEQYDPNTYSSDPAINSNDYGIHPNNQVANDDDLIANGDDSATHSSNLVTYDPGVDMDSGYCPKPFQWHGVDPDPTASTHAPSHEEASNTREETDSTVQQAAIVQEEAVPVEEESVPPTPAQEEAAPIGEAVHEYEEESSVHDEAPSTTPVQEDTPPSEETSTVCHDEETESVEEEAVPAQEDAAPIQEPEPAPAQEAPAVQEPPILRFSIPRITITTAPDAIPAPVQKKLKFDFGVDTANLSALLQKPVILQAPLTAPKAPRKSIKDTQATPSPKQPVANERKVAPKAPQKEAVKADKKEKKKTTKTKTKKMKKTPKPQKDAVVVTPKEPTTPPEASKTTKLFAQIRAFQDEWQNACKTASIPRNLQDCAESLVKELEKLAGKKDESRTAKQLQLLVKRWEALRKAADGFHRLRHDFSNEHQTALHRSAKALREHVANEKAYRQAAARARDAGNRALAARWEAMAVGREQAAEKARLEAKESLDVLIEDYLFYQQALEDLLLFFPDEEVAKRLEEMASMTLRDYHGRIEEGHGMFGFAFKNVAVELDYGEL